MDAIDQETEELLRVMLIRSVVLGLQLTNRSLQTKDEEFNNKKQDKADYYLYPKIDWGKIWKISAPHFMKKFGKSTREFAL